MFNFIKKDSNEVKTQINTKPTIIGDFSTPVSPTDTSSGQTNKQKPQNSELKDITSNGPNYILLYSIYRIFHPNAKKICVLLSSM